MSQQTISLRSTSIEPSESSDRIRWRSLLFAIFLLLLFCAILGYVNGVADGRLVDTDAYSWVNRVSDLRSDGNWFDDTIERINPPIGHKQHWSRPFDVLLLVGGLLGEPFVGFTNALLSWAIVLPCLLGAATFWVLWWGFSDLLDDAGVEALALLAALQFSIVQGFMAGRPDHQALIGWLLISQLGVSRKAFALSGSRRHLIMAGLLSALGLWVGMELIIVVVAIMMAITFEWLLEGNTSIRRLAVYAVSLASASVVCLVLENGVEGLVQTELDELSIVFVTFAVLSAVAFGILGAASGRLTTPSHRVLAVVVVAFVCGAVLVGVFPDLLAGPLGSVDLLYERTRLRHIAEIQPLIGGSAAESIQQAVPGLSLLPFAIYASIAFGRKRRNVLDQQLHLLLVPAILYVPLAVGQIRWLFPLSLLLVVPAALGVQRLMRKVAPHAQRVHLGMMAVAAAAALWWLPFLLVPVPDQPARCDVNPVVHALNGQDIGPHALRLMTYADYGPELLFRTPHSVFSIPNHRHQPGYTATYQAMTATDASDARAILERNAVDLVLVCSDAVEAAFYGGTPDSFHARLVAGDLPAWLSEVPVSGGEPRFRLYEVNG